MIKTDVMLLDLLQLNGLEEKDIYPNGKPTNSKCFWLKGTDAYTIKNRGNYKEGEFLFLKQYAYYHCAAPCYGATGRELANKFETVKKKDAFHYLVAKALINNIEIF